MDNNKEKQIEELLRAERQQLLGRDFSAKVMARVRQLPDPELLKPAATWRDWLYSLRMLGTGEKVGAALVLLGLALMFVPGTADALGGLGWELAGLSLDVSFGDTALSASLASVATVALSLLMLVGLGAYGARATS